MLEARVYLSNDALLRSEVRDGQEDRCIGLFHVRESWQYGDEIRFLTGLHVRGGKSVHFADAWVYGSDGGPGATYDPKNDYARKNREPPRRIDYIFTRGPDAELRGEPMHARLAFHEGVGAGDATLWPSDHFGVYAEIMMAPRSL